MSWKVLKLFFNKKVVELFERVYLIILFKQLFKGRMICRFYFFMTFFMRFLN